jgi:hypothetical protein
MLFAKCERLGHLFTTLASEPVRKRIAKKRVNALRLTRAINSRK